MVREVMSMRKKNKIFKLVLVVVGFAALCFLAPDSLSSQISNSKRKVKTSNPGVKSPVIF